MDRQLRCQGSCRVEPVVRVLRQEAEDKPVQPDGNLGTLRQEGGRGMAQVLGDDGPGGGSGEGRPSREHLEQHTPQGIEIRPAVHVRVPGTLLRAHVVGSPHRHARGCERLHAGGGECPGDPEVRHHRLSFLQEDVLGFDVPMDDPLPVGVVQGIRHLAG
jgi:hypothetical protein